MSNESAGTNPYRERAEVGTDPFVVDKRTKDLEDAFCDVGKLCMVTCQTVASDHTTVHGPDITENVAGMLGFSVVLVRVC